MPCVQEGVNRLVCLVKGKEGLDRRVLLPRTAMCSLQCSLQQSHGVGDAEWWVATGATMNQARESVVERVKGHESPTYDSKQTHTSSE